MIYLYVKQHSITKLKYFGRTIKKNPFRYPGSGTRWTNHINKHGKDYIQTIELYSFDNQELCTEFALKFSADNNIVESEEWANQIPENGLVTYLGSTEKRSEETRLKISKSHKTSVKASEARVKLANSQKGVSRSECCKQKMRIARSKQIMKPHSEETKRKISLSNTGKTYKHSEESNKLKSIRMKGKIYPPDFGRKISESKRGVKPKQITCPHCSKSGSLTTMHRWHFDNCKAILLI